MSIDNAVAGVGVGVGVGVGSVRLEPNIRRTEVWQ